MSYDLIIIGSGPPKDVIPAKAGTQVGLDGGVVAG